MNTILGELGGERGGVQTAGSSPRHLLHPHHHHHHHLHHHPAATPADLYPPPGGGGGGGHLPPPPLLHHPGLYDVMHPAGPLAMVAPLHPFDTSRLSREEEESLAAAAISSHASSPAATPSGPPTPILLPPPPTDSGGGGGGGGAGSGGGGGASGTASASPAALVPTTSPLSPSGDSQQPQPPAFSNPSEQAQFEADKRQIYKHPLFPLLALLFEKCELATQSAECPSSEGFNMDIQAFVQHQQRDKRPLLSDSDEANELMIRAIQVLRIHLLELEKVQELCKDFCNRYITCLKGKMQSENLLRSDYGGYDSDDSGHSRASSNQPYLPANGL